MQAHQRFGARHADFELHRQHRQTGQRDRHDMLGACHLREHLLGRNGHHLLHIGHAGARKGNQHIGHGDVDLRLFLARSYQHGKHAQQQCQQGQQRCDVGALKQRRDAARNT